MMFASSNPPLPEFLPACTTNGIDAVMTTSGLSDLINTPGASFNGNLIESDSKAATDIIITIMFPRLQMLVNLVLILPLNELHTVKQSLVRRESWTQLLWYPIALYQQDVKSL